MLAGSSSRPPSLRTAYDFMAMRLLLYVEELSPEHFLVIRYFADPAGWYETKGIARPNSTMGSPRPTSSIKPSSASTATCSTSC